MTNETAPRNINQLAKAAVDKASLESSVESKLTQRAAKAVYPAVKPLK